MDFRPFTFLHRRDAFWFRAYLLSLIFLVSTAHFAVGQVTTSQGFSVTPGGSWNPTSQNVTFDYQDGNGATHTYSGSVPLDPEKAREYLRNLPQDNEARRHLACRLYGHCNTTQDILDSAESLGVSPECVSHNGPKNVNGEFISNSVHSKETQCIGAIRYINDVIEVYYDTGRDPETSPGAAGLPASCDYVSSSPWYRGGAYHIQKNTEDAYLGDVISNFFQCTRSEMADAEWQAAMDNAVNPGYQFQTAFQAASPAAYDANNIPDIFPPIDVTQDGSCDALCAGSNTGDPNNDGGSGGDEGGPSGGSSDGGSSGGGSSGGGSPGGGSGGGSAGGSGDGASDDGGNGGGASTGGDGNNETGDDNSDAQDALDEFAGAAGLSNETIDVSTGFGAGGGFLPASCPADFTADAMGTTITITMEPVCVMASNISGIVVALGALAAVSIAFGGTGRTA